MILGDGKSIIINFDQAEGHIFDSDHFFNPETLAQKNNTVIYFSYLINSSVIKVKL